MCGIAGIAGPKTDLTLLASMLKQLTHRGPDDQGQFVCSSRQVALGHQRLAILDLSPMGHQPMVSGDGRYVITFNGEIYNFRELRAELLSSGVVLKSQSDTEVIVELYARLGASCVQRLDGMFAFAIWDKEEQTLFCARDALGIKPFYYWQIADSFAFASELRAVLQANLSSRAISKAGLEGYFLYGSVPEPYTLVDGVMNLPAGHILMWRGGKATLSQFWNLQYGCGQAEQLLADPNHPRLLSQVRQVLDDSVRRHFVSDVPVGIFLSGGIDSTAVLALAHAQNVPDLKTFCISFDQVEFNEGELASRSARHFGTEHHEWRMTPAEGRLLFNEFLSSLDQPTNDGFNTFCVSKFARRCGLKVVLSGLGGDELFGGYPSFQLVPKLLRLHRHFRRLGYISRHVSAALASFAPSARYKRLLSFLGGPGTTSAAHWAVRGFFTPVEVRRLMEHYQVTPNERYFDFADESLATRDVDQVAELEAKRYMGNQLLRDSDVMSMSVGLELRTPLVDRKLWDAVTCLDARVRLQPGKKLLTDAVPEVPEWIVGGKKRGFRFPFENWVSDSWADMFNSLEHSVPVRLGSWSRKWSLLVLEHFIDLHKISRPNFD